MKNEWSLKELAGTIKNTQRVDKDYIIIIDGGTGSGKSTIGIKLAIVGCPWFDLKKDIIFSRDELIEKISTARPGSFILVDEAINILFKRDFATKKQKFIIKLLDMCRDRNLCLILCVPNFWSMDKHILEGRVKLRMHIARTGLCFMWRPIGNPFTPDRWCRKYNEKVCYNWDVYPNAKRTKGFLGYLKFGDLAEKYKSVYLEIKAIKKAEVKRKEELEEKQGEIQKKRSVEIGRTMMLLTLKENGLLRTGALTALSKIQGESKQVISARLKRFNQNGKFEEEQVNPDKSYN